MTRTTAQDAVQFAGSTPFVGHHIQGHSVNVKLVREVPEEVLRTSVTHFGTRGLFGKPVRRTVRHDNDNVKRKRWRIADSLRRKVKLEVKDRGHQGASGDNTGVLPHNPDCPRPVHKVAEGLAHSLPPPFPPPNIVNPSSSPTYFSETGSWCVAASPDSEPQAGSTIPTFANHDYHVRPTAHHLGNSAVSVHPARHYDGHGNYDDVYIHASSYPPALMSTDHSTMEALITNEPADVYRRVAASTTTPTFTQEATSGAFHTTTYTRKDQPPKVLQDGLAVDASVNTRIVEIISYQGDIIQEKPAYLPSSSPVGGALSERSLTTSASMPSYFDTPDETHSTWCGYSKTSAAYAHASYAASIPPCSPIASHSSPDISSGQNRMPLVNECFTPIWSSARQQHEGWSASPPQNGCGAFLTSPSLTPEFNHPLGNNATRRIAFTSDLVDHHADGPATRYNNAAALLNEPFGSPGFIGASMNVPQDVWKAVPELHLARGVDVDINTNAHKSCPHPQCFESETDYTQSFDGSPTMAYASWASLIPRMSQKAHANNGPPLSHFSIPYTPFRG